MTFIVPGYQVDRLLGAGSQGQVWLGHDAATGDPVALKRIPVDTEARAAAARTEAALLAALDHPNLIALRAFIPIEAAMVLVLELAEGGSLAGLLSRRRRLTPQEVVATVSPVAAALAQAHDAGVLHGDVSPANILFTTAGRPKLTDLGLARMLALATDQPLGTPAYLDPTIAAGGPAGMASDVFSLAAVALHALTGAGPWSSPADARPGAEQVLAVAATGEVVGRAARLRTMPPEIAKVLDRALDPEPCRRGTAAELALDLRAALPPAPVRLVGGRIVEQGWGSDPIGSSPGEPASAGLRFVPADLTTVARPRAAMDIAAMLRELAGEEDDPIRTTTGRGWRWLALRTDWAKFRWVKPGWVKLGWVKLGWVKLGWAKLDGSFGWLPELGRRTGSRPANSTGMRDTSAPGRMPRSRPSSTIVRRADRTSRTRQQPIRRRPIRQPGRHHATRAGSADGRLGRRPATVLAALLLVTTLAAVCTLGWLQPHRRAAAAEPRGSAHRSDTGRANIGQPADGTAAAPGTSAAPRTTTDRGPSRPAAGGMTGAGPRGAEQPAEDSASIASSTELAAVLAALDAVRERAFALRRPDLLVGVYASPALLAADTAQLLGSVPAGCSLVGVRTSYRDLRPVSQAERGTGTGREASVTVTAALPAATLSCAGAAPRATRPVGPTKLRLVLADDGRSWRINSQRLE